jgi:hypothetical protein
VRPVVAIEYWPLCDTPELAVELIARVPPPNDDQYVFVPLSRSPLPARFVYATQLAALQKPPEMQSASPPHVVPQVPAEHRNPLQLWVVAGTQDPLPLQTRETITEVLLESHFGVESQICVES